MSLQYLMSQLTPILPVVYGAWKQNSAPKLPYAVVLENGEADAFADDTHYYTVKAFDLEVYFDVKNPKLETYIETTLYDAGFVYSCNGDEYIDSEKMFERVYRVEKGE